MIYSNNPDELFVEIDRQFLSDCSTKKVMVYIYLGRFRSWADNIVYLTIEQLVKYFGYKPNNDEGKINSQFRDIIQEFIDAECISASAIVKGIGDPKSDDYIKPIGAKDIFSIKIIDMDMFKQTPNSDDFKNSGFVKLSMREMNTMLQSNIANKSDLIMCYLSIKQYINQKETETTHKIAFPTIETIGNVIDRQSKAVVSLIDELVSLKLLYRKNCGSYKITRYGNTIPKNFPIVYAIEEKYLCQSDTVLSDYFKVKLEDMGFPFVEPPHKGKKNKGAINSASTTPDDGAEVVHTDSTVTDKEPDSDKAIDSDTITLSGTPDDGAIEIKPEPSYSFDVQKNDIEDKPTVDMSEYELIKLMGWDKQDEDVDEIIPVKSGQKSVEEMDDNEWWDSLDREEDYSNNDTNDGDIDVSSIGDAVDYKMPWEDEVDALFG